MRRVPFRKLPERGVERRISLRSWKRLERNFREDYLGVALIRSGDSVIIKEEISQNKSEMKKGGTADIF